MKRTSVLLPVVLARAVFITVAMAMLAAGAGLHAQTLAGSGADLPITTASASSSPSTAPGAPGGTPAAGSTLSQDGALANTTLAAPEPASSTYVLQPYDLIQLEVYNEPDLSKPARLGADGTALLPLIGNVKVGGLTVAQATEMVTKKYGADYLTNPNVMITVTQYRKSTFSVLGGVSHPGLYEIREGAKLSVLDAISLAGGFIDNVGHNAVTVNRTVDGKDTAQTVKGDETDQASDRATFAIQPGDRVVVSAEQKSQFSILGQVQHPGLYEIPQGRSMSVIEAISTAGGYTVDAAQNQVTLKRVSDGKVDLFNLKAADMAQNAGVAAFALQPGDTISVPLRASTTFSILGEVQRPGIYDIPEGRDVNIVQAILMAGGYTRTAAQNSVTVKRDVNGKLTTVKVRAGAMAQDERLVPFQVLPGDIVKVNQSLF